MKMYSIYDKVSNAFTTPFYAHNDGMAVRMFSNTVNDPSTQISQSVADYSLFRVGLFDEQTGLLTPESNGPERVMFALELKEENNPGMLDWKSLEPKIDELLRRLDMVRSDAA